MLDPKSLYPFVNTAKPQMPKHKQSNEEIEITGYMPKRRDFDVEFDNDAELLLAEMEFNGLFNLILEFQFWYR